MTTELRHRTEADGECAVIIHDAGQGRAPESPDDVPCLCSPVEYDKDEPDRCLNCGHPVEATK